MITAPGAPAITFASGVRRPPRPSPSHQTPSDHATDAASASLTVGRQAMPSPSNTSMTAMAIVASAPCAPISRLAQPDRAGYQCRVAPGSIGHRIGEAAAEHEDLNLQHSVE